MRRIFLTVLIFPYLLINFSSNFSSIIIKGDSDKSDRTFNFSIKEHAAFSSSSIENNEFLFYVAANEPKAGNNYAVSFTSRGFEKFIPLTPEKVILNRKETDNPLNGAKISSMTLFSRLPVLVKDSGKNLYMINNFGGINNAKVEMLSSPILNDSKKQQTSEILKLAVAEDSAFMQIKGMNANGVIFALLKNHAGSPFGADGSGIALVQFKKTALKGNEKFNHELVPLNANPFNKTKDLNVASPITGRARAIKINKNATIISDVVDMYWDSHLKRLYAAISVQSNNASLSGARAIIIGRLTSSGKLYFDRIAPDSVFLGRNDQIVATGQPNSTVSIDKVRVLHSSTRLSYLIVANGNKIYSLPLVNKTKENRLKDSTHGTLAKFNQTPKDYFKNSFFVDRAYTVPAKSSNDVLTENDQAAIVGGANLALIDGQKISDIFISGDSVFVSIGNNYDGISTPGLFYSQAIFDEKGRISNWTSWQRIGGTDDKIFGSKLDTSTGQFYFMKGLNTDSINTIAVTKWGRDLSDGLLGGVSDNQNVGLTNIIESEFSQDLSGVQGLFDFSNFTLGFNNLCMQIFTGFGKILFVETARVQGGFLRPNKGDFKSGLKSNSNGLFPICNPITKVVSIKGGALQELGPITSATIASDLFDNHWIVVGGSGGLAILCDDNGNGWNGTISLVSDIPAGLKFKKIGNYSFVQKLQSDGKFLYVLTNQKLDRIELSSLTIKNNSINPTNLTGNTTFGERITLSDFGVSGKFALIATSSGLFRVGNGRDISIANNVTQVDWTFVQIPEISGPALRLFFISSAPFETDFANKGQVYVISSYRGLHQTTVNRFFVNLASSINDNTILPMNDLFIQDKLSHFINFGDYKDYFFTNGALLFALNCKDLTLNLDLNILTPEIKTATTFSQIRAISVPIDKANAAQIIALKKSFISGALLVSGSFGLRVAE